MEMWNNQACSKCATARHSLTEAQVPFRLRSYLDEPPDAAELSEVLRRLGAQPWDICRLNEPVAADLGLASWPRDAGQVGRWIAAMVAHPELIQRPILLLDDGGAIIGRTQEALNRAIAGAAGPDPLTRT